MAHSFLFQGVNRAQTFWVEKVEIMGSRKACFAQLDSNMHMQIILKARPKIVYCRNAQSLESFPEGAAHGNSPGILTSLLGSRFLLNFHQKDISSIKSQTEGCVYLPIAGFFFPFEISQFRFLSGMHMSTMFKHCKRENKLLIQPHLCVQVLSGPSVTGVLLF